MRAQIVSDHVGNMFTGTGSISVLTDTIQWADRCRGNCRRWIWCCTSCKTSALGNSRL